MRIYTIYDSNSLLPNIVSIKEGFNWAAFIFALPWAAFNKLWLWAIGILLGKIFIFWFLGALGGNLVVQAIGLMGVAAIIGWISNDIKRYNLTQRGFKEVAILLADSKKASVERYAVIVGNDGFNGPQNRAGGPW